MTDNIIKKIVHCRVYVLIAFCLGWGAKKIKIKLELLLINYCLLTGIVMSSFAKLDNPDVMETKFKKPRPVANFGKSFHGL